MMLDSCQIILQDLEKIFLIYNTIKTTDDQIRDEKLQYDVNREAAKISALSFNNIGKAELKYSLFAVTQPTQLWRRQLKIFYCTFKSDCFSELKNIS